MKNSWFVIIGALALFACKKNSDGQTQVIQPFNLVSSSINDKHAAVYQDVNIHPAIKFIFSTPVKRSNAANAISLKESSGTAVNITLSYSNNDSAIIVQPGTALQNLKKYTVSVSAALQSQQGNSLSTTVNEDFLTSIDSTDKFPRITDSALLTLVEQQTFKYFWDFGHPVSGMARERNSSGDVVTTGGTGFGIMSMVAAVNRNFISRTEGRDRILKIANFLLNNCLSYHGAFSHWINGATGATVPFSANDNGADLVETAYLVSGLITAREYFNTADATEADLRGKINTIWNRVEWNWFRQNNQNVLYWHWSPDKAWIMNVPVRGWNESLITYVLAASSATDAIPNVVYNNGWANNGGMVNNNVYYGYTLPLGPANGGPLFFEHYSFLGINPNGLRDAYAKYDTQTVHHSNINFEYCKANPRGYFGYSNLCWGLTASDVPNGYNASEPNNDVGVIAPTAAIASINYTPAASMDALKFFYYTLGDKLWGQYGFVDAFKLSDPWFADSYLAIDEGPIIVMIENYRTGLIWNLFSNAPEIKQGLKQLGFTAPYL